jgi:hypothetical protein
MAKRCPTGFVCSDRTTVWLITLGVIALCVTAWISGSGSRVLEGLGVRSEPPSQPRDPHVIIVQTPSQPPRDPHVSLVRPDVYPEPVRRLGGLPPALTPMGVVPAGPFQQIGVLTAEGGSSSSAAPDRTILPLYGRELDPRRSRWNYYTRTDGSNPVQVPVRVRNRVCDDDTNGCDEVYDGDSVNVPVLGRSFKASIYRKSIFG